MTAGPTGADVTADVGADVGADGGGRLAWADTAKGACIVLVVLWHVTRKDYLQLPWHVGLPITGAWGEVSEVLLPVRMPLFFAISGLFAARQLARPWRRVLVGRVLPLLYVFVMWTLLQTLLFRADPAFDTAMAHGPGELVEQLTVTPGNLWYLGALAAYVAVARATRRIPRVALVAALLLSAVAAAGLVATPGNRYGLLTNLVWFLLGTQAVRLKRSLPHPGRRAMLGAVVAFVVAASGWQLLDADTWFGVRPLLGALGIAAGASVAVGLSRVRWVGPTLAGIGRRTLPVYVLHLPLVALAHRGTVPLVTGRAAGSLVLATVYPAVLTVLVLAVCLLAHRLLVRVRLAWLFTAPWLSPSRRAPGPATAPSSDPSRRRLPV